MPALPPLPAVLATVLRVRLMMRLRALLELVQGATPEALVPRAAVVVMLVLLLQLVPALALALVPAALVLPAVILLLLAAGAVVSAVLGSQPES